MNEAITPFTISLVPVIAAAVLTPGYIINFVSSRLIMGKVDLSTSVAASVAYYSFAAIVSMALGWEVKSVGEAIKGIGGINLSWIVFLVAFGPLLAGVGWGIAVQRRLFYGAMRWKRWPRFLRLNPVMPVATAWDFRFIDAKTQWLTVHTEDESKITALYEAGCVVSTDPAERDIFLKKIHKWEDKHGKKLSVSDLEGILLTGNSIKKIEFHSTSNEKGE